MVSRVPTYVTMIHVRYQGVVSRVPTSAFCKSQTCGDNIFLNAMHIKSTYV